MQHPTENNVESLATVGDAVKGDDEEVRIIMWNGRVKILVQGLEIEISIDVLKAGGFRWWNRQIRIYFGFCLGGVRLNFTN